MKPVWWSPEKVDEKTSLDALGHTKTHLTDKSAIKSKIKEDISAFKNLYFKKADAKDLEFIKKIQEEFESLLEDAIEGTVPADIAFKELTDKTGKAGALLRGLRVREGLTQAEFAEMIDYQANLSSMESGKRPIGKNKAKLIAEKFNVDYRYSCTKGING